MRFAFWKTERHAYSRSSSGGEGPAYLVMIVKHASPIWPQHSRPQGLAI